MSSGHQPLLMMPPTQMALPMAGPPPGQPGGQVGRALTWQPGDVGCHPDSATLQLSDAEEPLPVSAGVRRTQGTETRLANLRGEGRVPTGPRWKVKNQVDRLRLPGGRWGWGGSSHQEPARGSPWRTPSSGGSSASPVFRAFDPWLEIESAGIERECPWGADRGPRATPWPQNVDALMEPIPGRRRVPQRRQGTVIRRGGNWCQMGK